MLVVNPELEPHHIEPVELRDALYSTVRHLDRGEIEKAADAIAAQVARLEGVLASGAVEPSLWMPRQPVSAPRFVGRRTEMWRIHSALHSDEFGLTQGTVGPGVAQIRGLAGIGKTLLAREYSLRFSAAYPGGVFWLEAGGDADGLDAASREASRRQQLRAFAASVLGAEEVRALEGMGPDDAEAALRHAFTERDTSLWVVDDLPNGLAAEDVYAWVGPATARTIITTRSGEYTALLRDIVLDVLEPDDALRLLTTRREPSDAVEREAARATVEELGRHALALDVAGASVRFKSYGDLLARVRDLTSDELELAAALSEVLPTDHERSIAATLSESLSHLNANARDVLLVGSLLARAPILTEFFAVAVAKLQPELTDADAETTLGLDRLESFSLIEQVGADAWQVHPLVARTVELVFADPNRERARDVALASLNELLGRAEIPRALLSLLPHAQKLVERPRTLDEATVLDHVAAIEHHTGDYHGALASLEKLVSLRRDLLGLRDTATLDAIGDLAATACDVGEYARARELQESLLAAQLDLLGPADRSALRTTNNLATTYQLLGDLPRARELRERALSIARESFGPSDQTVLELTGTLAVTINQLGDPQTARELGQTALDGLRHLLEPNDLKVLGTMNNLAIILIAAGDLEHARELQEEVLAHERELLGPEHPDTLGSTANLANTLALLGDTQTAHELMEEVSAAQRNLLGPRHPETIKTQGDIAVLLSEKGDLESSRALNEAVVKARREILGPRHPDTLATMGNLAHTLRELGDLSGALELGRHVIAVQTEVLGPNHPETLNSMMHLSIAAWHTGDCQGAREWQEAALEGFRTTLGVDHPTTLGAMSTLRDTLLTLGDAQGARKLNDEIRTHGGDPAS